MRVTHYSQTGLELRGGWARPWGPLIGSVGLALNYLLRYDDGLGGQGSDAWSIGPWLRADIALAPRLYLRLSGHVDLMFLRRMIGATGPEGTIVPSGRVGLLWRFDL